MTRVTSKLQVTIPKVIADRYGIEPGGAVDWLPAGEAIRVVPQADPRRAPDRTRRLDIFDRATARQRQRETVFSERERGADRDWRREELYERGRAR